MIPLAKHQNVCPEVSARLSQFCRKFQPVSQKQQSGMFPLRAELLFYSRYISATFKRSDPTAERSGSAGNKVSERKRQTGRQMKKERETLPVSQNGAKARSNK